MCTASRPPVQVVHRPITFWQQRAREGLLNPHDLLYIRQRVRTAVPWLDFLQAGAADSIPALSTRANSAVVMIRASRRTFAITFGYGWTILKPGWSRRRSFREPPPEGTYGNQ